MAKPRVRPRRAFATALALGLALCGCNLFSWTHDAGSSDDPATLLMDAEDAFAHRDYGGALLYAEKGISKDPSMTVPRLRYVAAQAVLAHGDISISSWLEAFTNQTAAKAGQPGVQAYDILRLSEAELRRLAFSCPRAAAYLGAILRALDQGTLSFAELASIQFDVDVGFGVSALLTAFVTVLDEDQDLGNGFSLNRDVGIQADDAGGYSFRYTGAANPDEFIRTRLFCPLCYLFREALEGIYDAYRGATGRRDPVDLTWTEAGPGPLPEPPDKSLIIGEVLEFTHRGMVALFGRYGAGCACSRPAGAGR